VRHVAERERQEPGRVDLAVVGDEDDPAPVARALRLRARLAARRAERSLELAAEPPVKRRGRGRRRASFGDDAPEERPFHRAHDHVVAGRVEQEVADGLVLGLAQLLERGAAADGDQEEELPDRGAALDDEPGDLRQLVERLAHHRGVHLHRDPVRAQPVDRGEGGREVPGDAADRLVGLGRRAVEAD
jgi:hypothetical protein